MSAHLDSGELIKLSEAATRLGFHVETLRLRVRRGELPVRRGPHGAFFVTAPQLAAMKPPVQSGARPFQLRDLEWTWGNIVDALDAPGLPGLPALLEKVRADPSADRAFYNALSVVRLRIAALTSSEIASLLGISARQVRRLTGQDVDELLERTLKRCEKRQDIEAIRRAQAIVIEIENRLHAAGLRAHAFRPRRDEPLASTGRPRPAVRVRYLDRQMRANLRGSGLAMEQVDAIALVGMGSTCSTSSFSMVFQTTHNGRVMDAQRTIRSGPDE